jgi:hypothetical protein
MKRKMIFLPDIYSKDVVNAINTYFDSGYEIDDILDAAGGRYIVLVRNCNDNFNYTKKFNLPDIDKCALIEENIDPEQRWVSSNTEDVNVN